VRRIVCDTGPLLHLDEAKCLEVLRQAGEVHMPPAVDTELRSVNIRRRSINLEWIYLTPLAPTYQSAAAVWQTAGLLHGGEAEAIELARQLNADWFLTDDASARLVAHPCSLEVHGSLGVVLWAAAGHLTRPAAEAALKGLAESSLWISSSVFAEAKSSLIQIFEP